MDEFALDAELTGTFLSMEFGWGGRIRSIWSTDPNLPEEGEEFQFVLGPVSFGEEISEDYLPGTILLGARTDPNEPWVVGRNTSAEPLADEPHLVEFEYEIGLLPEIRATGKFYEIPGPIPQVIWDLKLTNRGKKSIEIGELAFPFALNNLYEGFARTERGSEDVWRDRVMVQKAIGGAASYLFAQRLTAEPPGLLIFPGDDTSWEFYASAPGSLAAPYRWSGVPIVYLHSRAAIDREGWPEWANGHTSLILEPGDSRTVQTRFVPVDRDKYDSIHQTMAALGRPTMKVLPGAVAPASVGIAVEVAGTRPTRFTGDAPAHLETDSDEEGGFCYVLPENPGPLRLTMEDTLGRISHAHLHFTEPIEALIHKRADWIMAHQFVDAPGKSLDRAIVVTDIGTGRPVTESFDVVTPFFLEGGLADALFLAEKNTIYPERAQIEALDRFIDEFLRDDLQNPGNNMVGSTFADEKGVSLGYATPSIYPLVFNFYFAMYRVARMYGETKRESADYLKLSARTAIAMLLHGIPRQGRTVGFPSYAQIFELLPSFAHENLQEELERLIPLVQGRAQDLLRRSYPQVAGGVPNSAVFSEAFTAANFVNDEFHMEQALRCGFAGRSLAPSWWWYGSDPRQWDELDDGPLPDGSDHGELCLGFTSVENSGMFFSTLDRDYGWLPEAHMRLAFGGMLGSWALVHSDGSASMAYCPDNASKLVGHSELTGDIGVSLFHYLHQVAAYVLPSRTYGIVTFGCHFEVDDTQYIVRPWDGVGRRVVLRQVDAELEVSAGVIREMRLDLRKRWISVRMENPCDKDLRVQLWIRGLWGEKFQFQNQTVETKNGELDVTVVLPARSMGQADIQVAE